MPLVGWVSAIGALLSAWQPTRVTQHELAPARRHPRTHIARPTRGMDAEPYRQHYGRADPIYGRTVNCAHREKSS